MSDHNEHQRFDADHTKREDEFGRRHLASVIARQLMLIDPDSGFVVGVEGEWGSGKTFLLDLVRAELERQSPQPLVIDLNPWLISGADSVVNSFLAQLAAEIGNGAGESLKKGIEVGSKLLGYLSAIARVSKPASLLLDPMGMLAGGIEIAATAIDPTQKSVDDIKGLLSTADIRARKRQVEAALKELGCRIVVVVDDLDRLPSNEIRVMFQAIKAVADFPGVIYLVAYDPDIVDEALDSQRNGRARYREKIIQAAFRVPHLLPWERERFLHDRLDEVVRGCLGSLPTYVDKAAYDMAVFITARLCEHPRDVLRLCNRLRICLVAINDNIDTADLMVIEALTYRFENLRKAIRTFQEDFSGATHSLMKIDDQEAIERGYAMASKSDLDATADWERHLSDLSAEEKKLAVKACRFLFDRTSESGLRGTWTQDRPIREPHLLAMYCSMAQTGGVPSPAAIQELLGDTVKLKLITETDEFESWLPWIVQFPPRKPIPDIPATLDVLIETAWKYLSQGRKGRQAIDSLCEIWTVLAREISDAEFLGKLFLRLVADAPLSMSCDPVVFVARQHHLLTSGKADIQPKDILAIKDELVAKEIIAAWRSHVSGQAANGKLLGEPALLHILYRWRGLPGSSYRGLWQIVEQICSTADGLAAFCQPYRDTDSDLRPDVADIVHLIWNIDEFVELLTKFSLADQYVQLIEALRSEGMVRRHAELVGLADAVNAGAS